MVRGVVSTLVAIPRAVVDGCGAVAIGERWLSEAAGVGAGVEIRRQGEGVVSMGCRNAECSAMSGYYQSQHP
jgi:hypothetical protein